MRMMIVDGDDEAGGLMEREVFESRRVWLLGGLICYKGVGSGDRKYFVCLFGCFVWLLLFCWLVCLITQNSIVEKSLKWLSDDQETGSAAGAGEGHLPFLVMIYFSSFWPITLTNAYHRFFRILY